MSYCRWSSMDYQCDLYIYDDVDGGLTVHVAAGRLAGTDPYVFEPIGLSRDGETFNGTREETISLVESLIEEGYRAPADLLDTLRAAS